LIDIYFLPNAIPLSFAISLIVGVVIITLTHQIINRLP
jgi:hypothetical protein